MELKEILTLLLTYLSFLIVGNEAAKRKKKVSKRKKKVSRKKPQRKKKGKSKKKVVKKKAKTVKKKAPQSNANSPPFPILRSMDMSFLSSSPVLPAEGWNSTSIKDLGYHDETTTQLLDFNNY